MYIPTELLVDSNNESAIHAFINAHFASDLILEDDNRDELFTKFLKNIGEIKLLKAFENHQLIFNI